MRFERNLYAIVTGIVLCCLLIGGLFEWQDSGAEEGWRFANFMQRWGPVALVVVAVGVVWLGWYWLKLAGTITLIAKHLRRDKSAHIKPCSNAAINVLSKAINEHTDSYKNYIAQLEKQIEDLQIQLRLSLKWGKNIEAIIYSICDAVIVVDEYDKLLMANEAAGKLFNFDFIGSRHRPIGELIDPDKS